MTNEHTHMLAYWFLSYIEQKSSSSSSAINSRISRGASGGGLKHMLTVHPPMFRVGAVCGGLGDTVISQTQHEARGRVLCLSHIAH